MKKLMYTVAIAAAFLFVYFRIILPFITTGRATVTTLYFGNASIPPH